MKKKWVVGMAIALLLVLIVVIWLIVNKNGSGNAVSIADDCWNHVTNLKTVEQDDGKVEVTLTAPDYVSLAKQIAAKNPDDIMSKNVAKAVETHPEIVKEYIFIAHSSEESDMKAALLEQISYELVAFTLSDLNG